MSDDQFQTLAKRFDQLDEKLAEHDARFAKIDKRFDKIDERFNQQDETIVKLYQHMQGEFAKIHAELTNKADRDQVDQIYNLLDEDLKRRETDEQERQIINHQLDRHEDWIERASEQVGVSYER